MPRASVRTTAMENPRERRRLRKAKRMSLSRSSIQRMPRVSRTSSFRYAMSPSAWSAAARAAGGAMPRRTFSAVCRSMWSCSSSSSSCSTSSRRKSERNLSETIRANRSIDISYLLKTHHRGDGACETVPIARFDLELLSPGARQRVELGSPVVLTRAPLRRDPTLLLQLVERRVERTVAHLQHVRRQLLEPLADRPAVHRFERQHLEDEKVQRALHQIVRLAHGGSLVTRYEHTVRTLGKQEVTSVRGCQASGFIAHRPSPIAHLKDCNTEVLHGGLVSRSGRRRMVESDAGRSSFLSGPHHDHDAHARTFPLHRHPALPAPTRLRVAVHARPARRARRLSRLPLHARECRRDGDRTVSHPRG